MEEITAGKLCIEKIKCARAPTLFFLANDLLAGLFTPLGLLFFQHDSEVEESGT